MGCDCCKEVNPADYSKCQQDMERILRNKKPTSSKRYIAPCGESYTFGAKITMPKKRRNVKIGDKAMTREEEIRNAIDKIIPMPPSESGRNYEQSLMATGFESGVQWADDNPKSPWIKITEKIPPHQEPIIIAMKNKNKEDGIWLYDLCKFFGVDYTDNNNWKEKVNWEIPIYWMPIPNLPK